jgi:hypothetical protein
MRPLTTALFATSYLVADSPAAHRLQFMFIPHRTAFPRGASVSQSAFASNAMAGLTRPSPMASGGDQLTFSC